MKLNDVAKEAGATVLREPVPGYGRACLKGIEYVKKSNPTPDIVVFLDADHSDFPEEIRELIKPILEQEADLSNWFARTGQQRERLYDTSTNFWQLVGYTTS